MEEISKTLFTNTVLSMCEDTVVSVCVSIWESYTCHTSKLKKKSLCVYIKHFELKGFKHPMNRQAQTIEIWQIKIQFSYLKFYL